jgi:hypothetical protein
MLQVRSDRYLSLLWRSLSFALGLPPVVQLDTPFGTRLGWSAYGIIDVPGGSWGTYYDYWRDIVTKFSYRQLTNSQDRLPALSGLADEFQRPIGDTYVAGLWRQELPVCLAWQASELYNPEGSYKVYELPYSSFVSGPFPESVKPGRYVAPSWSWASVQGPIRFTDWRKRRIVVYAKVKGIHLVLKHIQDPLGSFSDGALTLYAPVVLLNDPQVPCARDYGLCHLHDYIRTDLLRRTANLVSEFYQHHIPHPGRIFALVKLLHSEPSAGQRGKYLQLLPLESCEGGHRRLCCFGVQLSTLSDLDYEAWPYPFEMQDSDREYINPHRKD